MGVATRQRFHPLTTILLSTPRWAMIGKTSGTFYPVMKKARASIKILIMMSEGLGGSDQFLRLKKGTKVLCTLSKPPQAGASSHRKEAIGE